MPEHIRDAMIVVGLVALGILLRLPGRWFHRRFRGLGIRWPTDRRRDR